MIEIISRFPTSLSISIFCVWLRPYDVAKVDTALCSWKWRKFWLELVGTSEAVFCDPECDWLCGHEVDAFVNWGIDRRLRFNEIALCGPTDLTLEAGKCFFLNTAERLIKLSCCGEELTSFVLTSLSENSSVNMTNLCRVELGHSAINHGEAAFFAACCATLKELFLRKCFYKLSQQLPTTVTLSALKVLSIDDSLTLETSIALICACPVLSELWLCDIHYSANLLTEAARRQPSLTVLSLSDLTDLSAVVLAETFQALPKLQVVLLCDCGAAPNDASIKALLQCCPRMHALWLECCDGITDDTLLAIRTYCAKTLTHFAISQCDLASMRGLTHLVQHCKALVDLTVGYVPNLLHLDGRDHTLDRLLLHATQLQALDLTGVVLDRAALNVLCHRYRSLQHLCLFNPEEGSDLHCIARLVAHLPALRRICTASEENNDREGFRFTSANVAAWQRMRPGLVVTDDVDRSPFWDKYVFPMFPLDDWTEESSVGSEASGESYSGSGSDGSGSDSEGSGGDNIENTET
jgi:hypothetical protein